MRDYLFAYGTIAEDNVPPEISDIVKKLKSVGEGFIFGQLYDLGEYPGAILEHNQRHKIFGKILELPAKNKLLEQLDAYEGFDPKRPSTSLFVRKRTRIQRPKRSAVTGWVYEYNGAVDSLPMIKEGRYSNLSVRS